MQIARLSPRLGVPFGMAVGGILAVTLLLLAIGRAEAHGIAGNRFFVGTLTFDDPAVNDELSSKFSALKRNAPGGTAVERQLTTETSRLLTPNLAIGAETSWIDRGGHNPSGASGICRRPIKMSPLCQIEMTLPGDFSGGVWGDGTADERRGACTAGGAAGLGSATADGRGGGAIVGA